MTAAMPGTGQNRSYINEKIKVEGLKRKKRRLRLKARNQNENAIEKFVAQSSKSAKYAKTTVKKRDASASADPMRKIEGGMASAAAAMGQTSVSSSQVKNVSNSNNNSSQAVGQGAANNFSTNNTGSAAGTTISPNPGAAANASTVSNAGGASAASGAQAADQASTSNK